MRTQTGSGALRRPVSSAAPYPLHTRCLEPRAKMTAARRAQERAGPRFVYVTSFGSHRCGGVLWLGGRRSAASEAACRPEEPQGAAAADSLRGGEWPPDSRVPGEARSDSQSASTGLTQKNLSKKFDFPIPLSEASKKTKKRKKDSAWNSVSKVISKMLEENEKYRLRLKSQQSSTEKVTLSLDLLTKEDCEEFKDGDLN